MNTKDLFPITIAAKVCGLSCSALSYEPLFAISQRTDYLEGYICSAPYDFQVCVSAIPEKAPDNAVRFPACTALSLLYFGNYEGIEDSCLCLGKEVKKRGLIPAGFVRGISLAAPYWEMRSIQTDTARSWCFRLGTVVDHFRKGGFLWKIIKN